MELIEVGDSTTKLLATSAFMSVEDRDGMVSSGMEEGMQQTYDMLDEVLQTMN
jgi:hypothetical protein